MYNIKTLNKISNKGLDLFEADFSVDAGEGNVQGYLVRSAKMHDMVLGDETLAIARAGAGVNNIPIDACSEQGVVVFNTPGANANAVKELVLMSLLLASRKVAQGIKWVGQQEGDDLPTRVEKQKSAYAGPEVQGKKLGVVGLGAIGVMVANAADALGMDVLGYDPFISVKSAWGLSSNVKRCKDFDELLATCDYISIHVPLLEDTKHMFNKETFKQVKPGIRLLNFSRGALVNDDHIIEAIDEGKVSCYVTDFPNEKLLNKDEIICIPHLGASTPESEENCAIMAVNQLMDYLKNGNIKNSVNFPSCNLGECEGQSRLALLHRNQPAMVGQITNILAEKGINISNMNNRSKGDYAYTMLDLDSLVSGQVMSSLSDVEGIIKVRCL